MALLAETAALLTHKEHAAELDHLLAPYASRIAVAGHFFPIGAMSRYTGMLAAVLSRLDEAARRLEDAAATNAAIGARPWVAHAKADHARVLLTRQAPGDREHARDLLRDAGATYQQLDDDGLGGQGLHAARTGPRSHRLLRQSADRGHPR